MLDFSNLCDRTDLKIAPAEIISTLGDGKGAITHRGEKAELPPIDHQALKKNDIGMTAVISCVAL